MSTGARGGSDGPSATAPSATALVGLLAEEDRLKVVAAMALGAGSLEAVAAAAGIEMRRAASALERLVTGGLVVAAEDGSGLRLASERFKQAARAEAERRESTAVGEIFEGVTTDDARVLRNFVSDGRLRLIPANRSKRLVILDWLARRFEPGRSYPERDVNLLLGMAHPDVAALRRHLVDDGFLDRRDGCYWRTGGTVDID